MTEIHGGFPKLGVPFRGEPHDKDYSIWGSRLWSPHFEKLPHDLAPGVAEKAQAGTAVHYLPGRSWSLRLPLPSSTILELALGFKLLPILDRLHKGARLH